ncbi:hypothetical protein [Exiguobacterium sp. s48]|uniref:hypothetical protein n=1 Tax=Exiguobacterium sp. s48 TaxID=2751273 RepID=UPI001BE8DFFE|nr:hypothetical protein [Exiguobacterium sp. s48]
MMYAFEPTIDVLEAWSHTFVPEETLYWIDSSFLEGLPSSCLVIPRQEFFHHPLYRRPDITNPYVTWQMGQEVTYIVHAFSPFLHELQDQVRNRLLEYQVTTHRGLILPISVTQMTNWSDDAIVEKDGAHFLVLHHANWNALTMKMRYSILLDYAKEWDTWEGETYDDSTASHLKGYVNRFPIKDGSNCLAATLFAITGNEEMVHQWIHPETFLQTLKLSGYDSVEDHRPTAGDVMTFWNTQGQLIHACYCVRENLYFNKHGQVRFNPWKLIQSEELKTHWGAYRLQIARKK